MKWDVSKIKELKHDEHELGATIPEGGTAQKYKTGGWRTERPVKDEGQCSNCLICWVYCPDSSIVVKNEKVVGFDLDHCKGCGICAKECPRDAIEMVDEAEFRK